MTIDWHALHSAFQMNVPEVRCFFSIKDGKVLKLPPGDPKLAEVRSNSSEFVAIEAIPSRIQYQWLDEFIKTLDDAAIRRRMEAAINGKGAFRRFKDILLTLPDERRRWFEFRDHMMRTRVVDWINEIGVLPRNDPPWVGEDVPTAPGSSNDPAAIEALRDFLIEWADSVEAEKALTPLALEKLALSVGERFVVQPKG